MSPSATFVMMNNLPYTTFLYIIGTVTASAATDASVDKTTVAIEMEALLLSASMYRVVGDGPCFGRLK